MKFRNSNPSSALSFELGGTQYEVPVNGTCDIPDQFAYAVKLVGLALEPVADKAEPAPEPKAAAPEVKAQQAKR